MSPSKSDPLHSPTPSSGSPLTLDDGCKEEEASIAVVPGANSDDDGHVTSEDEEELGEDPDDENVGKKQEHFFEGVEKLLEVWFTAEDGISVDSDLRRIPR